MTKFENDLNGTADKAVRVQIHGKVLQFSVFVYAIQLRFTVFILAVISIELFLGKRNYSDLSNQKDHKVIRYFIKDVREDDISSHILFFDRCLRARMLPVIPVAPAEHAWERWRRHIPEDDGKTPIFHKKKNVSVFFVFFGYAFGFTKNISEHVSGFLEPCLIIELFSCELLSVQKC